MSDKPRVYLYARVSTSDGRQNLERQRRDLRKFAKEANWQVTGMVEDCISGSSRQRPGLDTLMRAAADRKMDLVCVTEISRLSRSGIAQVLEIIQTLKANNVDVWSITEPHLRTSGAYGELFLAMAAAFSKIELENLRIRIKSGVKTAKENGKHTGRPVRIVDRVRAEELKKEGLTLHAISKELRISRATLARRLRKDIK
jgi:DNA invertase Pin-like site-specific DNA recombinase